MNALRTTLFLLGGGFAASLPLTAIAKEAPPAPAALVSFTEAESMKRLERSKFKVDFFHLANNFEGQTNKAFCGPTSSAIVLNALRGTNDQIAKPRDPTLLSEADTKHLPPGFDPLFARYTQNNLFSSEAAQKVKTREQVLGKPRAEGEKPDGGLQLRQLHGVLQAHGLDAQLRIVDDKLPEATIKAELKQNLKTANDYVIVNYHRPVLGQKGGGHISPLGAYDAASDSFLIMDVNPNGQQWVWVKATDLIRSMRTPDVVENRGYLLVKEGQPATAQKAE
ncbi:MAG TPA: phytochelatin synthase family protein [Myxococcaceae bacterium]|jgi:hypothetical protein